MTRARPKAFVLAVLVAAMATLFGGPATGTAAAAAVPELPPGGACTVEQWQADFRPCLVDLPQPESSERCLTAPTPSAPDSGLGGWFASAPPPDVAAGAGGFYTRYGYAGYNYLTYDVGCFTTLVHPDYKFETTVANGEFMAATAIIGASNALRERAWDPSSMWGWADPLVRNATRAIYEKVFTAFGVITLAIVGLYLLWRSRQSDMSAAMTTAGWALLVMVAVTAIATWPVHSARLADGALSSTLGVVHNAVGPPARTPLPGQCPNTEPPQPCQDARPPALRASDTATESMIYRNWLRGTLGSADSTTAKKYGMALYDARSLSWAESVEVRKNPAARSATFERKNKQWLAVAEQIRTEDPEAYEYLQGTKGMERIGAGFIAILAAVFFALFDITASILVLLGFLIFRWAVIAAPILGTIGLLRPASAGLRRLANAVVAAIFNIAIFGTGAAVYLFAVDLIMNTPSLAGWLQVVLVWLCGVVGWLLLRPYRRITQLGGKDSTAAITSAGSWHRRFFGDLRSTRQGVSTPGGTAEPELTRRREVAQSFLRPEARADTLHVRLLPPPPYERVDPAPATTSPEPTASPPRRMPAPAPREKGWERSYYPDEPIRQHIFRPSSRQEPAPEPGQPRVRAEAR